MENSGNGGLEEAEPSNLVALRDVRRERSNELITFNRRELDQILRIYGFMVAANEWRDYAIDHLKDRAIFSVFRRTSETPLYQIIKNPKLARKQGAWSIINANGLILKRGHDLSRVLGVFDQPLKLIKS